MSPMIWLAALILFGIGEAVTVGLTSIWFALGSLGALIVSALGFGFWPQFIVFVILSAVSMALIRPIAKTGGGDHRTGHRGDRQHRGQGTGQPVRPGLERPQQPDRRRHPRGPRGQGAADPGRESDRRAYFRQIKGIPSSHRPGTSARAERAEQIKKKRSETYV